MTTAKDGSNTATTPERTALSYRDAGVDIDAGNALVENIKAITKLTHRPEVMSQIGGFGALCEIPAGYKQPVLVSATDGVGTKLRLAMQMGKHDTIGIDLVAMCVNDLIVCGAEPLFLPRLLRNRGTQYRHRDRCCDRYRQRLRACRLRTYRW